MKKTLLALVILLFAASAEATDFFVSPTGRDTWDGSKERPFATLERARDEVRTLKKFPKGGVTVWVRGGTYELAQPFALEAGDSGTKNSPIAYRAYPNETVIFTGAKSIGNFRTVTDPDILKRVNESAHPYLVQANLKMLGITDFGGVVPDGNNLELFFDDRRMPLSRWPNYDFTTIYDLTYETPVVLWNVKGDKVGKIVYDGDRPEIWVKEKDAWLFGYWFWDWSDQYHKIESIDTVNKIISIAPPYHYYGYRKGQRYYALNILSELEYPGEWYLDRDTGILYFWPPARIEDSRATVSVTPTLITMNDVEHVTFSGLTLEGCRNTAVAIKNGGDDLIAGCVIRNAGSAVSVSGGKNCGVVGCDIYNMGSRGISLTGGDRNTLTPAGHYADNNIIHNFSETVRTYTPAIFLSGVGQRVSHNLLYDAPHTALLFTGNDHLIEYNEVHDVCYETNDVGAFYTGRDLAGRGTVVRYNYFHDLEVRERIQDCSAVYLDDCNCGTTVYGNIFYHTGRGVLLGGGRDNVIDNNIFVGCKPYSLRIDDRGIEWLKINATGIELILKSLEAVPYKSLPWSTRYPELVNILDDDPYAPKGNVVRHNINWDGKWLNIRDGAKPLVLFEGNLLYTNPLFMDEKNLDFRLKDDSPALKLGFEPIPYDKIGIYDDEYRRKPAEPKRIELPAQGFRY